MEDSHLYGKGISDKILKQTRTMLEKEHCREFCDSEVLEVARLMQLFAEIAVENIMETVRRQEILEELPGGFHFDKKGYSCVICRGSAFGEKSWFDANGLKCMNCQRAINSGVIPPTVALDNESYYTESELSIYFNLSGQPLREMVKRGFIVPRIIKDESGKRRHFSLFLLKDNKGFFPPKKKLRIGGMVEEEIGGQMWQVSHPWYHFVEPLSYLAKYGISNHLKVIDENAKSSDHEH